MNEYETLVLLIPDLANEKVEELTQKLNEIIKNHQGHPLTLFNLGKRKLAYRVGKHSQGIYVYFNYLAAGSLIAEIERILKIDDQVLQFITVKLESGVDVEKRKAETRELTLSTLEDAAKEPREVQEREAY